MCVKETSSSRLNIALDLSFSLCRSKVCVKLFSYQLICMYPHRTLLWWTEINQGYGKISNSCNSWFIQVEDVLFAAGEALSFLWGGVPVTADLILKANYSLSMASNFLMGDVNLSLSKNSHIETNEAEEDRYAMVRGAITKKLFDDLLYSTRKEERCAGTVWLLSITMYCGHNPAVQKMLPDIQVCLWFPCKIFHSYFSSSLCIGFIFFCHHCLQIDAQWLMRISVHYILAPWKLWLSLKIYRERIRLLNA